MILPVVAAVVAVDAAGWVERMRLRRKLYDDALAKARERGKPMLVVGRPTGWTPGATSFKRHGPGDVCIDIAGASECPVGLQADVTDLSRWSDDSFGSVFSACVLEQVEDLAAAWREINRVSGGHVYIVHAQAWTPFAYWLKDHKWAITSVEGSRLRARRLHGASEKITVDARKLDLDLLIAQTADRGSYNAVAATGYDKTAIARDGPSAPVQHLERHAPELLVGEVLDFGSGRGADADALGATPYDPHHPSPQVRKLPRRAFHTVLCLYVLNVLPPGERAEALTQAAGRVKPGGHLVLAVRPRGDLTTQGWARHLDGHQVIGEDGTRDRFQRGYTPAQLTREVRSVLGSTFVPVPVSALSGAVLLVLRRAP
jgi:hypothetical protein